MKKSVLVVLSFLCFVLSGVLAFNNEGEVTWGVALFIGLLFLLLALIAPKKKRKRFKTLSTYTTQL